MTPAIATALAGLINLIAPALPEAIAKALSEGLEVSVTVRVGRPK
jgi:ABC-type enterobactin transport system permease subunit